MDRELTLWGFDLVIVEAGDAEKQPVAVFPTAFEGDTPDAAARVLQLVRPKVPYMPAGRVVAGVRPHTNHLMHLFGTGAPCENPNFVPIGGPAVHIQAARNRMASLQRS